ncbi:MAG TPA: DUF2088 domain-containing protein [Methylomirabilota bacterium]|nr:DUF2088 domain-containing protein [Methylomirabilota bacterium]
MSQLQLTKIRQNFGRERVGDIESVVAQELSKLSAAIKPGASLAVAAGSRGIANIARVVKATVEFLRARGAQPFVVPAMGSHGGATAEGQAALLASYGITEQAMGCPIRATMEVVELPSDGLKTKLFMDRFAWESDGAIVINRIKPHTDFHGSFESGLVKMIVIGLGKERQAFEMHGFGVHGLRDLVPEAAKRVLATGKILGGVGIVENAYDETAIIEAVPAANIWAREPQLLALAKQNMPRLPVDDVDVLIVDRLGKNISGTGMDTNIIGRTHIVGEPEPESPRIKMIVVTDLTDESHGNATGIGFADVTSRRLFRKIDFAVMYKNVITAGFPDRAKLPIVAETDREAMDIALRAAGCRDISRARVLRIRDTLHLGDVLVSDAVLEEIRGQPRIETLTQRAEACDAEGALSPM